KCAPPRSGNIQAALYPGRHPRGGAWGRGISSYPGDRSGRSPGTVGSPWGGAAAVESPQSHPGDPPGRQGGSPNLDGAGTTAGAENGHVWEQGHDPAQGHGPAPAIGASPDPHDATTDPAASSRDYGPVRVRPSTVANSGSGGAAAWARFFIPQVGAGDRWHWRGARIALGASRVAGRRRQDPRQAGPLPGPAALWRSLPPAWKG